MTEGKYPVLLHGHPWIKEFNGQIDWFRGLVLASRVVRMIRYRGSLNGELGLAVRYDCTYSQVQNAVTGFVIELNRPNLLQDRNQKFILFGPLSLVNEGMTRHGWESFNPGSTGEEVRGHC